MTSSSMVDWTVALSTASRLVKPGPDISREGAAEAVADLRRCAVRAEDYVRQVTGLTAASGTAPVLVVDRPRWIEANIDGFRQVLAPLNAKTAERAKNSNPALVSIGARITGVEVGALLSYLAPKVLGQFDPFYPGVDRVADAETGELPPGGRLLLVAPNIVAVERELELVPSDFRLWVCLHEETHRVQFTAVPWLRGYLNTQIGEVVATADVDGAALAAMLREAVKRISEAARGDGELSIVDLVQTPAQREIVDRITAVMSLLEGHADVVMDGVGPDVIGTHRRDPPPVRRPPPGSGLRQDHPQAAGPGRQDAAVPRRRRVLQGRHRRRRDGRPQPGLDLAGDAADQGRDRRSADLARPDGLAHHAPGSHRRTRRRRRGDRSDEPTPPTD